jgi:hypothetical protein
MFALVTKEPGSGFGSALSAAQPCSTLKKDANNHLLVWLSAPSPIRAFLHRKIPSTSAADILGFNCRQG